MRTFQKREQDGDLLTQIREGMAVYDCYGIRVGIVEYIHVSRTSAVEGKGYHQDALMTDVFGLRLPDNEIPDALRHRLQQEGYIHIDGGFLTPDCLATFDQIANVQANAVMLNTCRDDLVTL